MAAPPEVTTLDLSGTFTMNKSLSDDTDEILRLQGVSWFMRKLISSVTITLYVKQYKDANGDEHIDIEQIGTGGFKGNYEQRILTWSEREADDRVFGPVIGKSRRVALDQVEDEWQKEGWLADTTEHGAIQAYAISNTAKSGTTWIADVIWGFAEVDGLRRHTRKVHFIGPKGEEINARLVYDYQGPNTRE